MIFQILWFFIAENPDYMPYFSLASHMIILSALLFLSILQVNYPQGFPNREGPSVLWFLKLPIKTDAPMEHPLHLQWSSPPPNWKTTSHWKWFREKKTKIKLSNIYLCFNHKITLAKDCKNSTRTWFSQLEYSEFCNCESLLEKIYVANKLCEVEKISISFMPFFIENCLFFNWDSLHAGLNSHYEKWS